MEEGNSDCPPVESGEWQNNFYPPYFGNIENSNNPYTSREKVNLSRVLEEVNYNYPNSSRKLLKVDERAIIHCKLCNFSGTRNKFWVHLDENHKEYIIEKMSRVDGPHESFLNSKSIKENSSKSITKPKKDAFQPPIFKEQPIDKETPKLPPVLHGFVIPDIYIQGTNKIYYCGQKTNLKCGCCEGICIEGQCICPRCMQFNKKIRGIPNFQYINKKGFLSIPDGETFYCQEYFTKTFSNIYSMQFVKELQCKWPNGSCPDCQVIKKLLSKYQKYNK